MNLTESGRCPYCGSEDIEEYYDSTAECHEGRIARGSKRKANAAQDGTGDALIKLFKYENHLRI